MKGTNVLQQWNGIDYNQQPEEGLSQLPSEDYIQENDNEGHGKRDVEAANRLHQLALMQQKSATAGDFKHETSEDLNQLISSQG
ncbi:Hypothetical protein CINCED_3A009598 [Cinara cedri]|uniref:Uncharacterized protein n=1 Tax=Cinara cedri TaxID=506608 RepID=A0A5E4NGK3_9HEMI|nr:Hypothetical protein CINCED_3A009598 [Cinara cedri]